MADLLGTGLKVPGMSIDITGWLSNSWIWVVIVALIGFILIIGAIILIFFYTWKRKVVIFDIINGQMVPISRTPARVIRLKAGGDEIMKTLFGGYFVSAYGKRTGKAYWYLRGTDGYLYNFVLDSFATPKFTSGDVRLHHLSIDRMSESTYGKTGFLEKYAVHMLLFVFLIALILGMWWIASTIGNKVATPLAQAEQRAMDREDKVMQMQTEFMNKATVILRALGKEMEDYTLNTTSGLTPAPT